MKKKVDEKWVEAIAHCSVSLHGGEARRFVRRHARLVKDTSYNPYTYVEVELTVPWLEWSDDECTLNETTLMVPGFAQCMHMDQFNEHMGIVQAWVKAYEDLVKIVEKYRTVPDAPPEKEKHYSKKRRRAGTRVMGRQDDQNEGPSSGQCCIDLDECCD